MVRLSSDFTEAISRYHEREGQTLAGEHGQRRAQREVLPGKAPKTQQEYRRYIPRLPQQVVALDCYRTGSNGDMFLKLAGGRRLRSKTIVIASGACYRRPAVPRLSEFEGRGVWYWDLPSKRRCAPRWKWPW